MRIILIIIVTSIITSCSSTGPVADKIYYRFPDVNQAPINKDFNIARPRAMGILGNRPMVAQDNNGGLVQMSHNLWLDSPKILLYNYLNKIFTNAATTNTLQTQILSLEKRGDNAILAIKFSIIGDDNQQLFNKTYNYTEKLPQNSIPAFVKSIKNSLEKLVQQFINDIND